MPLKFIPSKKWIIIHPSAYTIDSAIEGNNYVDVVENIYSSTPQTGTLVLSKTPAEILGYVNFTGYDWASNPQDFEILAGNCHGNHTFENYITIHLDQNCLTIDDAVNLINAKFVECGISSANEAFKHSMDGMFCIAIRNTAAYSGEMGSFALKCPSNPCALDTLGLHEGIYVGTSDTYNYSSWSGKRFTLTSNLTITYDQYVPALARRTSYTVQEIYNSAMDWADNQGSIVHDVPMSAEGYASLGEGAYTDKIFILQNGWKLRPTEGEYQLTLVGTLITDDGTVRTVIPRAGALQCIFQVSSQGIITETVVSGITEQDKQDIANVTKRKIVPLLFAK